MLEQHMNRRRPCSGDTTNRLTAPLNRSQPTANRHPRSIARPRRRTFLPMPCWPPLYMPAATVGSHFGFS
jgi:hypothetical protein